jgi:hypothetical protein
MSTGSRAHVPILLLRHRPPLRGKKAWRRGYCSGSGAGVGGFMCRDRNGHCRGGRAAGARSGLGGRRGGRRSGSGDGDEWRAAAGGDGQGVSEAAAESVSWSDPGSERMTENRSTRMSEPSGEAHRESPVDGAVSGSESWDRARGAAAGGAGPDSAGARPGRWRRTRRARWGPGGSPAGPAGRRDD